MKSVVLSTTEAEYVAVSEVVKETKFFVPNAKEHENNCLSRFKWTMWVQYGWQIIELCQRGQSMLI